VKFALFFLHFIKKVNKLMHTTPLRSWVEIPENSDFSIYNFPFGIFQMVGKRPRIGSALGDYVIDLDVLNEAGLFSDLRLPKSIFRHNSLNPFIALGKKRTSAVRERLIELHSFGVHILTTKAKDIADLYLIPADEVQMLLPIEIGDYTDFYSSREHATNVGTMFRDPENALLPNWLHLPVGYHGRTSSIVVSGTPIRRPRGQMMLPQATSPSYGPSQRLDFELEMAFVIGKNSTMGEAIPMAKTEEYIFGLMLFNDWSARDIQQWEYVPLGPFLGKNFGSTLSPWVVTLDALDPFRSASPTPDFEPLAYLKPNGLQSYDIQLEVGISSESFENHVVCRSNFKHLYWSMHQQLAHHTVNGCPVRVGDLMASGTISGATPDSFGSMLELAWKGTKPLAMPDCSERTFIRDYDTVTLRGWAEKAHCRVGFGTCSGKIMPAG
jgi:fumarylacetoacetase